MASSSNIDDVIDQIEIAEQQRLYDRMEQERKDREFAERLYREQLETPPRPHQNRRGRGPSRGRGEARIRVSNGSDWASRPASFLRATSPTILNRVGPIRPRVSAPPSRRGRRGTVSAPTGRRQTRPARRSNASNGLQFNGDRLQARRGSEIIDVTEQAYFPDEDDDSDYAVNNEAQSESDNTTIDVSSESDSGSDGELTTQTIITVGGTGGVRTHAEPRPFARNLTEGALMRDNRRTDPNFQPNGDGESDESDDSGDSDDDNDSERSFDDSDEDLMDELGSIRAEPNNINQPIFDEDREMYNRELDLYHDDDEYQVPPAKVPKVKGKPVEPDSTWGDCTMCSNPPIKPQGCKKCLQFLGCADCVRRWHEARQGSLDKPNCPLCRAPWTNRGPGVQMMPTIEKHRKKQDSSTASSSGPSTSSAS